MGVRSPEGAAGSVSIRVQSTGILLTLHERALQYVQKGVGINLLYTLHGVHSQTGRHKRGKGKNGVFQRPWHTRSHREEQHDEENRYRHYGNHPYARKVEERMRRGSGMACAGRCMSVIECRGVDLARKPCANGQANEQKSHDVTRFTRRDEVHRVPLP